MVVRFLTIAFLAFHLSACSTIYYIDKKTALEKPNYESMTVYVTNRDHPAFEVLRNSGIFIISNDENYPNKLTLDAYHIGGPTCGLGRLASVYTLGLSPDTNVYNDVLSYYLTTPQSTNLYMHSFSYYESFSLWNSFILPFTKSEEAIKASALKISQRELCTVGTCEMLRFYE